MILTHRPPSSKWVPGGNTGEVKGRRGKELATLPHDKCPSNGHSPNVRNRIWEYHLPLVLKIHLEKNYIYIYIVFVISFTLCLSIQWTNFQLLK